MNLANWLDWDEVRRSLGGRSRSTGRDRGGGEMVGVRHGVIIAWKVDHWRGSLFPIQALPGSYVTSPLVPMSLACFSPLPIPYSLILSTARKRALPDIILW